MDNPCDLLVLDLGLPAVVALVIARRLLEQQPGLGIVMLTARGSLNDRLSGLEEGADACLVKPVDSPKPSFSLDTSLDSCRQPKLYCPWVACLSVRC